MNSKPDHYAAVEARLKAVEEENELLLLQLHQVQEELERHYERGRELEKGGPVPSPAGSPAAVAWVDDELPQAIADNARLQALVEAQRTAHQLTVQSALNGQLGDILIRGVETPGAIFSVPAKLVRVWRAAGRKVPPQALGGENYGKVIVAYADGGFDAVNALLSGSNLSQNMRGNAFTALARHLMKSDRVQAAEAARLAFSAEPRAFRLKWLAFRLHEAGALVAAEGMLDALPPDTPFSDSEARQASQLRQEAKVSRLREAKKATRFAERRADVEKHLTNLAAERDKFASATSARQIQIDQLKQSLARQEQESAQLRVQDEGRARLVGEQAREIESLKSTKAQLEEQKWVLAGRHEEQTSLALERGRKIDALELLKVRLEQEKSELSWRLEGQSKLALDRSREIESLRISQSGLEAEKLALAGRCEEQIVLIVERDRCIEDLRQAKARIEQELEAVLQRLDAQALRADELSGELEDVRQIAANLDQDRQSLAGQISAQAVRMAELGHEIEAYSQAKAALELQSMALAARLDEQAKLAAERGRAIEALQEQKFALEQARAALAGRLDEQAKLAAERGHELVTSPAKRRAGTRTHRPRRTPGRTGQTCRRARPRTR
ncbi:MAG: hypothetical protein KF778_16970 [Rhodocyclaceae bacterium]|nr:hypothetical protein [Rhodocyclaceae bacterium]